jgi:LysM repeat protein
MRSHSWGVIAVVALVIAAALLGVALIWQRGPQVNVAATPTSTRQVFVTPSPTSLATPTPTEPITYTVQGGDTLSAIAQQHNISIEALTEANDLPDPDVLDIGQVLIIPRESGTQPLLPTTEASTPGSSSGEANVALPPTITPSGPSLVEITEVAGIGNPELETITLSNEGGMVNLEAWTLSDPDDVRYSFPPLTLFSGGIVRIHSTAGNDTARDLYWNRTEPAWQTGELVTLRDADGNVVDTYIIP